jgi:hypothetical protein
VRVPVGATRRTDVDHFLDAKIRGLRARARRLSRLDHRSVGIRPQDVPYAPSAAHFQAANARLAEIDRSVQVQLERLTQELTQPGVSYESILRKTALVEREVDRARRAFGLFFDVFIQRGTTFAPALAACDTIAADCFQVVRRAAPGLLHGPILKPITYLEHSFSPATFRRGVVLRRLLGERNPFPLVRVPYERIESPWGMGVVLHEIGHNLQADLGVWQETQAAVQRRVFQVTRNPWATRIWTRWHKEIFADLIGILFGGPAAARSMKDFLAYPASRVLTFRPLGVHPTPYLRVFIQAEMLRRMGFPEDARRMRATWTRLYSRHLPRGRVPASLVATAPRIIPHVVDEVAYQTRRGLAQRALVDVVPFGAADERRIREAAREIARGRLPASLPPRFAVSASRYAFEHRLADPATIARAVRDGLARRNPPEIRTARRSVLPAAARAA